MAAVYIGIMIGSARAARAQVLANWREEHRREPRALMVGPVFLNPLRKAVIVDEGASYRRGAFVWPDHVAYNARVTPGNHEHPAVIAARANRDVRALLVWARFPYFTIAQADHTTLVTVRDMRFGDRIGVVTVSVPAAPLTTRPVEGEQSPDSR